MGLLSRVVPLVRSSAEAVHARAADGEHLWLAVRGAESLALTRDDGPDVEVATTPETVGADHLLTAVVPLAAALADEDSDVVELTLVHGRRRQPVAAAWDPRPDSPTLEAPTTADRRWQLAVHDVEGRVVVRRTRVAPSVVVLAVESRDDGVVVHLGDLPAGATTVTAGDLALPLSDDAVVLDELRDLPVGTNLPIECGGRPVVRARNVLVKPNYATSFPVLPAPDVELRWLRDGRLALFRREATT